MTDHDPAPSELVDGDEWTDVVATGDYVGQRAVRVEMGDVEVRAGRWSGVTLDGLRALGVRFADCDLAGFVLTGDTVLRNIVFERCRLDGAVFAGVQLRTVRIEDCSLDDVNLRMVNASEVVISRSRLVGADFSGATIAAGRFGDCDLRGVDFTHAKLTDVDLRGSELFDVRGADALRGTTIDAAQLLPLARSLAVALGISVVDPD